MTINHIAQKVQNRCEIKRKQNLKIFRMNQKNLILLTIVFLLTACETENFSPNQNALRDVNLIGTWRPVHYETKDYLTVFTTDGYYGTTSLIDRPWHRGFTGLSMLWHNITLPSEFELGEIYVADNYHAWTKKRHEGYMSYKLSENYDTLYFSNSSEASGYEAYIKNDFDLLFDGVNWIGVDSTKIEKSQIHKTNMKFLNQNITKGDD